LDATDFAVLSLSPVSITTSIPIDLSESTACLALSFIVFASAIIPTILLSTATRVPWSFHFWEVFDKNRVAYEVDRAKFDDILLRHSSDVGCSVREKCRVTRILFEDEKAVGSGRSFIHNNNGIIISDWQGEFKIEGKEEEEEEEQLTFKCRDVNKNCKFVVLRSYFTKSGTLGWMNGLVYILSGEFETSAGVFKITGYELVFNWLSY